MKKLVTIILILVLITASSLLNAESTKQVTGGCQAQMGELSTENETKINEIAALIDTGEDMKMLSELYSFILKDPTTKQSARPAIQKILTSVSQNQLDVKFDETYLDNVLELLDYYTLDAKMYPEYSYEASICTEILLIVFSTWLEFETQSDTDTSIGSDMNALQSELGDTEIYIQKLVKAKTTLTFQGVQALWDVERPLDVCAKKQLWEYTERVLGGGPYWPEGGIEGDSETVNRLKTTYENEQHELIREIAGRVISKIDSMNTSK